MRAIRANPAVSLEHVLGPATRPHLTPRRRPAALGVLHQQVRRAPALPAPTGRSGRRRRCCRHRPLPHRLVRRAVEVVRDPAAARHALLPAGRHRKKTSPGALVARPAPHPTRYIRRELQCGPSSPHALNPHAMRLIRCAVFSCISRPLLRPAVVLRARHTRPFAFPSEHPPLRTSSAPVDLPKPPYGHLCAIPPNPHAMRLIRCAVSRRSFLRSPFLHSFPRKNARAPIPSRRHRRRHLARNRQVQVFFGHVTGLSE